MTLPLYAMALYTGCRAGELFVSTGPMSIWKGAPSPSGGVSTSLPRAIAFARCLYWTPFCPFYGRGGIRIRFPSSFPIRRERCTPSRVCQEISRIAWLGRGLRRIRISRPAPHTAAQWVLNKGDDYRLPEDSRPLLGGHDRGHAHLAPMLFPRTTAALEPLPGRSPPSFRAARNPADSPPLFFRFSPIQKKNHPADMHRVHTEMPSDLSMLYCSASISDAERSQGKHLAPRIPSVALEFKSFNLFLMERNSASPTCPGGKMELKLLNYQEAKAAGSEGGHPLCVGLPVADFPYSIGKSMCLF